MAWYFIVRPPQPNGLSFATKSRIPNSVHRSRSRRAAGPVCSLQVIYHVLRGGPRFRFFGHAHTLVHKEGHEPRLPRPTGGSVIRSARDPLDPDSLRGIGRCTARSFTSSSKQKQGTSRQSPKKKLFKGQLSPERRMPKVRHVSSSVVV